MCSGLALAGGHVSRCWTAWGCAGCWGWAWAGLGWAGLGWAGLGWAGWVNTLHAMKEYIAIRRKVVASGCPSFKKPGPAFFLDVALSPKP